MTPRPLRCCLAAAGLSLVLLLVGLTTSPAVAQEGPATFNGHQVIRARLTTRRQLETLLQMAPDVWSERIGIGPLDVRIAPDQIPALKRSGIPYEVLIPDVQALIDRNRQGPLNPAGTWYDDYKPYTDVMDRLDLLAQMRPDLAQTFDVGLSLEGRMIRGIRLGEPDPTKPSVVFQSCQHAREWISVMTTTFLAEALINGDGVDDTITELLDEVVVYIIPIVNPDGYEYSWTDNRLWRKNRRDNGNGTFGVDLNRNWSFGWGGNGSSGNGNSETYRGPTPFSEPESTAVSDFLLTVPNLYVHVDVHSYSQLILQPWGWTFDLPPDHARFEQMGAAMEAAIESVYGTDYIHGPASNTLYLADGISPDWTYGELGASSFTFELRDKGQFGFLLPPDQIIPTGEETIPAFLYLMDYATIPLAIFLPDGLPVRLDPSGGTTVLVEINEINGGALDPDSPTLRVREPDGSFSSTPLSPLGDGLFEATFPPSACGETIAFYFEAQSADGETITLPTGAPKELFERPSIGFAEQFVDDFEKDLGWTVENSSDLTDGAWERGTPIGGGDRGDPPTDADGSGQCFLTDNEDGNSDVDGGATMLISPTLDASGDGDAYVSYWRWYSNATGNAPEEDVFTVEISNDDGQSWHTLEVVGPDGEQVYGGWYFVSFRIADVLEPTATMRLRFTAEDAGAGSVIEAGIDGVRIDREYCDQFAVLVDATVSFGSLLSGGLNELNDSDDAYLRTRSNFGFSAIEPDLMILEVTAQTSATGATSLSVEIESRLNQPNGVATVRLRNFQTMQWETIGTYAIGMAEETVLFDDLAATNRIAGDGTIRLYLKHVVPATFSALGFDSSIDLLRIGVD